MRTMIAMALVLSGAACSDSKKAAVGSGAPGDAGAKKSAPTVDIAKMTAFAPGTPASSIKAGLEAVGPGAQYRANFQDVAATLDHPWFRSVVCETKGYDHVEDCTFYLRAGALTTENMDAFTAVVDTLEPSLTSVRRKKIRDEVLGTFGFEWGDSEFSPDITLWLDWDAAGKKIEDGHLTICFTASEQRFPACARAMTALVKAEFPSAPKQ